ncbi:hypothetical protein P3X46_017979 [Hevea brasiliensis]|uniref:YGGT family protein n=1 Tax=Hevea brasiliensis TaxID=3981 RepID=A0ABQ9LQL9_HEVBR|nr:ylmG homolog protein 1-2, chloroplastic [Hevea brasiliensis]KAJ9169830.1 hypothetical protein P3X46_017979 [Hevea brasiliensis]
MALMLSCQTGPLFLSNSKLSGRLPLKTAAALSSPIQEPVKPFSFSSNAHKTLLASIFIAKQPRFRVSASVPSQHSQIPTLSPPTDSQDLITGSTRTLTTIVILAFSLSRLFINSIQKLAVSVGGISILPNLNELAAIQALQSNLVHSVGPLFFAALKDRPSGYLNTPLTVVAAGLAKWLDIYSGVLMVRVLLSWFPNIPWDRQPLSAIRDLCDPYLNLFRNIIPPIFDTLDVSPLLAFAVLGMLGSILHSSGGVY